MTKTRLIRGLRRAAEFAFTAQREGVSYAELRERLASRPSRRSFLKATGLAAMSVPLLSACGDDDKTSGQNIVVIGAGLAGLHCAYRLKQAGVSVSVYEASDRVGGRTFTARGKFADNQICELGGELIDSGHVTMQALASEFGLTLDQIKGNDDLKEEIFYFDGGVVSDEDLVAMFAPVAAQITAAIEAGDASDDEFARIDNMSINQWLANESDAEPHLQHIINSAYVSEYGLEVDQQTAWNMLYLIGADTPDPFRIYGDSDEIYHLHEGSDAIATAMANSLQNNITTGTALTKVAAKSDGRYTLSFTQGADVTADHVVFALPFRLLREVHLEDAGLSDDKITVINTLGYGTNAKVMGGFTERVWQTQHNASGTAFSDLGIQEIWDSARGQSGASGIITEFVGGNEGIDIGNSTAEAQMQNVLPKLDTIFPGTAAKYVANSAIRMHWPTAPFNKGSYACYLVGQYSFSGTEGLREGNLHFCGEHTSVDNQGYMEGAAETGARVADEIMGTNEDNALTTQIASARLSRRFFNTKV